MITPKYDLGDVLLLNDTYYNIVTVGYVKEIINKLNCNGENPSIEYVIKHGDSDTTIAEIQANDDLVKIIRKVGSILDTDKK